MPRPSQALLSREIIARAALDMLDEEGAETLTMRALASRLGVKGASLYNHLASKDELLDAVSELINEEIDLRPLDRPDWREGVAQYARGYRRVWLGHPNTITLIARRRVAAPRALLGYEKLMAALVRAGCTASLAAEVSAAVDYLVLGSAVETYTAGFDRAPADYRPSYPTLATALEDSARLDERGFELALGLLLDGLAARLELSAHGGQGGLASPARIPDA